MIKTIITLLFFYPILLLGQTIAPLAPIGSKWVYNFGNYGQGSGYIKVSFTKDTLIEGILCRESLYEMNTTRCDIGVGCPTLPVYSYDYFFQRNDSLFQLSLTTRKIDFVFNYKCRVGDSIPLRIPADLYNSSVIKIQRTGDTVLNGKRVKFWQLRDECDGSSSGRYYPFYHFEQILSNRLGSVSLKHKSLCAANGHFGLTLCAFTSGSWTHTQQACLNPTQEFILDLNIAPNPTTESLFISSPQHFSANYTIYNAVGYIVQRGLCHKETSIDVSLHAKGLYSLVLYNGDGQLIRKFIKL